VTQEARGYWRDGDAHGHRQFATLRGDANKGFDFEAGGHLDTVTVAYETWGTLNSNRSNAVLVEHALTGDSHVAGEHSPGHPLPGWWDGIVGPGLSIDTDRFFVVCANVLGGCQGTTGPSSLDPQNVEWGSRFPAINIRDQVDVEIALADYLGIGSWFALVGGSMGAMRVLEWSIIALSRVQRAVVLCVGASSSAEEIALSTLQIRAIQSDVHYCQGDYYDDEPPLSGLGIARGIGHFSYRTELELEERFGRDVQRDDESSRGRRFAVDSYLAYQGEKLSRRFDANSYIVLSDAMNHHDVGRDRGGIDEALARVSADVTVIGIDTDRLYPLHLQEQLVKLLPSCTGLHVVNSKVGHDGFLLEVHQIAPIIAAALS
jgi:homoserine O-acetyltransferase